MAAAVVVVASFQIKPGMVDEAIAALTPTIEQTHAEEGCISYALHRDAANPDRLVLLERWTSQEALESHLQQPYVADLGKVAGDFLADGAEVTFCSPVPIGDPAKGAL